MSAIANCEHSHKWDLPQQQINKGSSRPVLTDAIFYRDGKIKVSPSVTATELFSTLC